jgi:hypothetical protein
MLYQSASYNLFNYVNEVNAEVEALEDSIEKVRSEIEAHQEQASTHVTCLIPCRAFLAVWVVRRQAWGTHGLPHALAISSRLCSADADSVSLQSSHSSACDVSGWCTFDEPGAIPSVCHKVQPSQRPHFCLQASASEASAGAVVSHTSASRQIAEAKADAYDRRLTSAQKVLEQLKAGISSLFQTVVRSDQLAHSCMSAPLARVHLLLGQGCAHCMRMYRAVQSCATVYSIQ